MGEERVRRARARNRVIRAGETVKGFNDDPFRYIDRAVGMARCAVCDRHEHGDDKSPEFFKAGGEGHVYHLPCLAALLAGYRMVIVRRNPLVKELRKISDEGGGLF
jgi:hypothetical protein